MSNGHLTLQACKPEAKWSLKVRTTYGDHLDAFGNALFPVASLVGLQVFCVDILSESDL